MPLSTIFRGGQFLLVEVTGVPGENQTCSKSLTNFIVVSSTPHPELDSYLHH